MGFRDKDAIMYENKILNVFRINTIKREGVLRNIHIKVVWTISFNLLFFWSYLKLKLTICYHIFLKQ